MVKDELNASNHRVDLNNLFSDLQQKMKLELQLARTNIPHNGDMGAACEAKWREMLTNHLPTRYQVEKGIIVDSNGECSDSIDIIIFDRQYTNLLMTLGGQLFIPAESVYAVLEAKQEMSKGTISYASEKAESVRRLYRTTAPIYQADRISEPKPPIPILSGLICLENSWSSGFGGAFQNAVSDSFSSALLNLDLGCCVSHGSFEAVYQKEKLTIETSQAHNSLIFFMLRLMKRLQSVGTVAAVDFSAYEKWI